MSKAYSSDYSKTTKRILTPDEARLREIFAASALPECYREACKEFDRTGVPENWQIGVAMDAYAMADAMLAVRVSSLTKEAKGTQK